MMFSMEDFFSKRDQIRRKLWTTAFVLKKTTFNTENWLMTEVYPELYQISMMELFVKSLWLFFPKNSILDAWKVFWNTSKSNIMKWKNFYFHVYEWDCRIYS